MVAHPRLCHAPWLVALCSCWRQSLAHEARPAAARGPSCQPPANSGPALLQPRHAMPRRRAVGGWPPCRGYPLVCWGRSAGYAAQLQDGCLFALGHQATDITGAARHLKQPTAPLMLPQGRAAGPQGLEPATGGPAIVHGEAMAIRGTGQQFGPLPPSLLVSSMAPGLPAAPARFPLRGPMGQAAGLMAQSHTPPQRPPEILASAGSLQQQTVQRRAGPADVARFQQL